MTIRENLEKEIGKDRVLVVNSTMEAKEIITWQDAVTMLFNEKAYTLIPRSAGEQLRSSSVSIDKPLVVVLVKYAQRHNRIFDLEDVVTKSYVRQRDNFTCAYCGEYGNTVDHIQPWSRGGPNTWGNLVTACKDCNGRKADRTPEEAGMKRPVIKSGFTLNNKLQTVQDMMYEALTELSS
jgi:5-methylcytosine-specific restriction endonuclease McrA